MCRESSIQDLEECLENIHNCLDDTWKIEEIKYPQTRMEHLFEVVGNGIVKLIQMKTRDSNLWNGDHNENIDVLKMCHRSCEKWIKTCEQLTTLYWPNYSYHKWIGPKYSPGNLKSFADHIEEVGFMKINSFIILISNNNFPLQIISILCVNYQMTKLLTVYEQEKLRTTENLKSFAGKIISLPSFLT